MALWFLDGFDHSANSLATHLSKYTSSGGTSGAIVASPTRTGGGALQLNGLGASLSMSKYGFVIPAHGPVFLGFAFRRSGGTAGNFAGIIEGGVQVHVYIGVNAAGKLTVMRGSDLALLGTGTTPIFADTWYYLELRAVIDPTVGALELRVDGAVDITLANANTQAGATGKIDGFSLLGATVDPASTSWYVDDLYFGDGTGPAPQNYFLGPIKIETLLPQTDGVAPGSNAGLTPSTGVDHGALVDENPANATDYNSSGTIGAKDTYNYPSLTLPGAILGLQTNLYVQKSDTAARQVCAVVRNGPAGPDFDGAAVSPLTTFKYFSEVRALNPATAAAWTATDIAAVQAGMKVTA